MKRRSFLKLTGATGIGTSMTLSHVVANSRYTKTGFITEEKRDIPIIGEYDVIVCGAGPAGVSAAIESGRNGAKTLLIETNGCLGGVWTSGLLTWILHHENKVGFMREIEFELDKRGAISHDIDTGGPIAFNPEIMKLLLEDLCMDANVDVLFHTRVVASVKGDNNRLSHIVTESKSGREAWHGNVFIDTTGDGDLAALSGCGFDYGRKSDGATQPFSLLGIVSGIDFDEVKDFARWSGVGSAQSKQNLFEQIKKGGNIPSYMKPSLHPISKGLFKLMCNQEYGFSPMNSRDVTKATIQARKEVHNVVNGLRSTGGVWENIQLIATGEQIGTREGRRIHGLYTVTVDDMIKGSRFDDAVCRVNGSVNVHSVSMDDMKSDKFGSDYLEGQKTQPYDIPIRALIAKDVGGLLMAGRCISGDFFAHSNYRNTGNAVPMGQAAGRLAAYSSKRNIPPQEVKFSSLGL